jgi:cytochrome P450
MVNELLNTKFQNFHERSTPPIKGNVDKEKLVNVFRARGKRWKRLRTLANPAFSVKNIKKVWK